MYLRNIDQNPLIIFMEFQKDVEMLYNFHESQCKNITGFN